MRLTAALLLMLSACSDPAGSGGDAEPEAATRPECVGDAQCLEDDIVPDGVVPLGRAYRLGDRPGFRVPEVPLVVPFEATRMPEGGRAQHLRLYWRGSGSGRTTTPPFPNMSEDMQAGELRFDSPVEGDFQVGVEQRDVDRTERLWTYRALVGVSMGAGGTAMVGLRNAGLFDQLVALGAPFDWEYLLHYVTDFGLGGFCTGDRVGQLCDPPATTEQFEHGQTFEQWVYSDSGGSFDRDEYLSLFHDLSYAFGNLASYNPESPYLPAGLPKSELERPWAERCDPASVFRIEQGFYDDEYNPDGSLPVIAFCDGETDEHPCTAHDECRSGICRGAGGADGKCKPTGWFDDSKPHGKPVEVALAVDVNGDGLRNAGEPVIRSAHEPFDDTGADGLANADEPGFDPELAPDPSGDDYHWFTNPEGTENNWLFDEGEPYRDFGLDGVPDTADSPYDFGEGNGRHDDSPNRQRALAYSPRRGLAQMDRATLDDTDVYLDAGIRDLFNLAPSANQLAGALAHKGANLRLYDGFHALGGVPKGETFFPTDVDYHDIGEHVYVRYGKRNALPLEILEGDGAHVGTLVDAVHRFLTMLGFVTNRLPDGDYAEVEYDARGATETFWSEQLGGEYRYSIVLPPGYDHPDNADARYPVVYFLHGYGMDPEDLQATVEPFGGMMALGEWQKVIIVYPDGYCGETRITQCNDGIDNDGDGLIDTARAAVEACRDDGTCRVRGHACRAAVGLCCPADWAECGEPDPDCTHHKDTGEQGAGPDPPICSDGVDNDEDGLTDVAGDRGCLSATWSSEADCKKGTFFVDHAAWPDHTTPGPAYEGALIDLVHHVDATYRTKRPQTLPRGVRPGGAGD